MPTTKKLYLGFDLDSDGCIGEFDFGEGRDEDVEWQYQVELEVPLPSKKVYKVQITEEMVE